MKKLLSLLLGACTIFTACTNEDDGIFLPDNQLQLKFGVNQPEARAIFTESTLPNNNPVGVKLDDGDETAYDKYTNITFTGSTDDKGQQVWTPSEAVVLGPTKATLYAYYPCTGTESMDAIPVDMTAEDQTDWLYATPVENVNEDNASHAVTMNHALANINLTINRGSYVGNGNISSITIQSDAFATKGTFNAAQAEPAFTFFADTEGQPLTRSVTATLGSTTDIMVVPTATEANIDFVINVDGVNYTAQAKPVQLVNGNSYLYTLTLNSTFLGVSAFGVQPWVTQQKDDDLILEKEDAGGGNTGSGPDIDATGKANGVYVVTASGQLVDYTTVDPTAIGVALITDTQKVMIEKMGEANTDIIKAAYEADGATNTEYKKFHWSSNQEITGIDNITTVDAAKQDFNGKANTAAIIATPDKNNREYGNMGTYCKFFNESNMGYSDWYIPALGQLYEIYINKNNINTALTNIGGTTLYTYDDCGYWSSSEVTYDKGWDVYFGSGTINYNGKGSMFLVRFIRDLQ